MLRTAETIERKRSIEIIRTHGISGTVNPLKLYNRQLVYTQGTERYTLRLSPLEVVYITHPTPQETR